MEQDLSNYREVYQQGELLESQADPNPIQQFSHWFFQAQNSPTEREANAMHLSTIGTDGFPKTRVVLLKKFTHEGFIFFTNYHSEKGRAISQNPKVCLSFFWAGLERQVIIKGEAEYLPENLSDGYFESRPEGSRFGAIISPQSEVIPSREYLQERLAQAQAHYQNHPIERPSHWGGYLVRPQSIEFWQGRPNRLHDRLRYTLTPDYDWILERLAP